MSRAFRPIPERTENDVEANCVGWLQSLRWVPRRKNVGLFYTRNGVPIRIGKPGECDWCFMRDVTIGLHYMEIEFKRPGERPDKLQSEYMASMRSLGVVAIWVDSLEALQRWYAASVVELAAV